MQVSQCEPSVENTLSRHGSLDQVHRSLLRKYHRLLYPCRLLIYQKRLLELQSLLSKVPGVLIYVWTIHANLREFTFAATQIMHSSER